jgi:predicted nucleotidyltransferase
MSTLLKTVHGSHLYGLAHAASDLDIYEVIATERTARKRNIKQTINNGLDKTLVDMSTFMNMVDNCVPQALEALWSPVAEVDKIKTFRYSYRVNRVQMTTVYLRTARNFAEGNNKQKRHALRLMMNLTTALRFGMFNPKLTPIQIFELNILMTGNDYTDVYESVETNAASLL